MYVQTQTFRERNAHTSVMVSASNLIVFWGESPLYQLVGYNSTLKNDTSPSLLIDQLDLHKTSIHVGTEQLIAAVADAFRDT